MTIDLVSMTEAWLHNACSSLNLCQQSLNVDMQVFVDIANMNSQDGSEQHTAKSGCGIHREIHMPQRDTSCWRNGTRVENLELCQQHECDAIDPLGHQLGEKFLREGIFANDVQRIFKAMSLPTHHLEAHRATCRIDDIAKLF